MSEPDRSSRLATKLFFFATGVLGAIILGFYSAMEQLGARSHPVVDVLVWICAGSAVVALLSMAFDAVDSWVTRRSRRSHRGS